MLRDFAYHSNTFNLRDILGRFAIKLPELITLVRFEVITPDSFMWRIVIDDSVYYLYAEDYVPGIEHIKSIFNAYIRNDKWNLVEVKSAIKFEDAAPPQSAIVYKPPDHPDEMMRYAVDSGYDFVFFAHSDENADDALFSSFAPHGFDSETKLEDY